MGEHDDTAVETAAGWTGHDDVQLLVDQLAALTAWHAHRRATEEVVDLRGLNRDVRLDWERRQMVRARQLDGLVARSEGQLLETGRQGRAAAPRAVLVHRRDWVRTKVAAELTRRGVLVVAELGDGAEAVGACVVEQPDLLLVEDALPSMTGAQVVAAVRTFCGRTVCAAQLVDDGRAPLLREAGAVHAFPRRAGAAEVAAGLVDLLPRRREVLRQREGDRRDNARQALLGG